ncbi:NUDIX domain-containing protein [Candidatus Micrarchaeota archaeon]|nr:NUDIX domain-containing protein [Candidatus Micrarchaeota archaeon]
MNVKNLTQHRKSVGIVLYREAQGEKTGKYKTTTDECQGRQYLLLYYAAGHWDFPKGGQEAGESDEQTLRRELKEETGIEKIDIIPIFTHELSYFFREQGELIRKTVVFYLGRTSQAEVKLSFEHKDFAWLSYDEAMAKLTHKNAKSLLEKADALLDNGA